MKNTSKTILPAALLALSLTCGTAATAQNSTSSPYSMYGIGVLTPKEDVAVGGLGHAGIALAPSEWVNISNPAGICNLDSLSFYFNINIKGFYAHEQAYEEKASIYSANIDGISLGFRGRNWLSFAIGYAPFSAVGYKIDEYKKIKGSGEEYQIQYTGSGGLSQAYFNAAVTLFKHWSLGGNFSVLWGTIEKLEASYFSAAIGGEDIYNKRKYQANNIYWEVGTQFDFNIGQNNFRFGATYAPEVWLHSSYDQTVYNNVSRQLFTDDSTPERFRIPRMYGAGFTFQRKKFLGTIEYKVSEWGAITDVKFKDKAVYRDTYTIAGGIQYSPGQPSDPFYKRMRYRIGYYYGRDYIDLQNANLLQSGFSLGLTVPIGNSLNAISIAYEHQKRGTQNYGLIEEKVHNIKIGFNIREIWFLKRKFD